jgi:glycosyltransferase involved in cell wall biosynthesis
MQVSCSLSSSGDLILSGCLPPLLPSLRNDQSLSRVEYCQSMPTVDIIIPAYNAAKYLSAAITSVLTQTYEDWRIILVNDGSTDATGDIAAQFQQQLGDKMLVITQPNAGLPASRNVAIRASSAEFIAILDADDVWLPCRLAESLNSFALRPQAGISYGLNTRIDEDGLVFSTFAGNPRHAEGRIAPAIYMRRVELPCPTVTFRRRCIDEVGLFDESMRATEDRDLWLRIALRYEVAFVPEVIAHYRASPNSMSTDIDRMLTSQLQFIRKHSGTPGCGFIPTRIAISRVYKQRGEAFRERGNHWKALKSSFRSCMVWPFAQENLRTAASLLLYWLRVQR